MRNHSAPTPPPCAVRRALATAAIGLMAVAAPVRAETEGAGSDAAASAVVETHDAAAMARFLDRLMMVESGGRDDARNPRSTALGPFQFIESTFITVARRHFAAETQGLTQPQLLALRTNRAFARRAAEAFTRDNAALLAASSVPTTFANLRLAFLLGAEGAIHVLKAEPKLPVIGLVGEKVVRANPFMVGMTAGELAAWSERNLATGDHGRQRLAIRRPLVNPASVMPSPPPIEVHCNLSLPSCRRWLALAERAAKQPARLVVRRSLTR